MSNVQTKEERERERRAARANAENACAYWARRAFSASYELRRNRGMYRLALLDREASRVVKMGEAVRAAERRILDAARYVEAERARMAQQQ